MSAFLLLEHRRRLRATGNALNIGVKAAADGGFSGEGTSPGSTISSRYRGGAKRGRDQGSGVRMHRVSGSAALSVPSPRSAQIHHGDPVAHVAHRRQISDEKVTETIIMLVL
jgi:hypothetical protein